MAETQSAPSLRELSEAATQGEANYHKWGTDIRVGEKLIGMTSPAHGGNGIANRAFLCRLWNDYRAGRLIDPTTLPEAIASARAEGVREGLERAAGIADDWVRTEGGRAPRDVKNAQTWANAAMSEIAEAIRKAIPTPPTTPGGRTDG